MRVHESRRHGIIAIIGQRVAHRTGDDRRSHGFATCRIGREPSAARRSRDPRVHASHFRPARGRMAPWAFAHGRAALFARLQAIRLRERRSAQGRARAPRPGRHLRQPQLRDPARQPGRRPHLPLRHADGAGARRGVDRIRPARRSGALSRRLLVSDLPATRRGALARRQADHRRRRDLVVRCPEEAQPRPGVLLPPRGQGGEDRRARGHLHLRRAGQPRAAADRRPDQRAAEALVDRDGRERQAARHRRRHARAAARRRRLSHQVGRARPHHRLRARARLLGP